MKLTLIFGLLLLLAPTLLLFSPVATAQEKAGDKLPAAVPILTPALCGKGVLLLSVGEQSIGREEFAIQCQPDGYSASGHTQIKVATTSIDLNTTLTVDKTGEPLASTAKGLVNGSPFDQSVAIKGATATVRNGDSTKEVPFVKGTSLLGGNIFYMFQFLLARYDAARGGVQQLPIFPTMNAKVERVARDEARSTTLAATAPASRFDRYNVTLATVGFTVWVDDRGRFAMMSVPLQNLVVVREEYAAFVPTLKGITDAKLKESGFDYSAPPGAAFTAEEVAIPVKDFALAGTLLLPKTGRRPFPVVITITGSGQQTRDEYLPLAGLEKYRPFRQIAEALAARGIAVLRVDDRGVGKSTGIQSLANATSADFADDVRAQINYLRHRGDIDPQRIALVGHSEGGMIAPMVAVSDPQIAAIVLMAGPGKRGDEIILYQLGSGLDSDSTLTDEAKAKERAEQREMIRALAAGGDAPKAPAELKGAWMRYFFTYDPLPTIGKVRQPILILQGALDRQVTAEQADLLEEAAHKAGNKDVVKHTYANLNHLFLPAKTGSPSEYGSLSTYAIGDEVINTLADWLVEKLKAK
ncbi:MAG: alpha/beta hydrolase family protein [Blastocatellia bacterium]